MGSSGVTTTATADDDGTVARSLRFNSNYTSYLSRTPGSAGNQKTWSFSCWVKKPKLETYSVIFSRSSSGSDRFVLSMYQGVLYLYSTHAADVNTSSQNVFKDPTAWYHLLFVLDTTQSTAANRTKIYVNGVAVPLTYTWEPAEDEDLPVNTAAEHRIGGDAGSATEWFHGYLANIHFIDGGAKLPSDFTETDATTGQLIPKAYSGEYGTNGFYLKFADNSDNTAATIGKDSSGNGNNWTPHNIQVRTGGPTAVSAADGGLPFYNTTDTYGATKGSGYRTDSSAGTTGGSGLVLAIPGDVLTDEHDHVNTGGTALTVTTHGDVTTSSTKSKFYGTSAKFDGTGDALTFTLTGGTGSGDFTIEYWAYHDSLNDYITHFQNTRSATGFNVGTDGSGDFVWADSVGGLTRKIEVGGVISAGKWNHWAWVRSGTTLTGYLDGIAKATYTTSTNYSDTSFCIGGLGTSSENLTGYLQDIRFYVGVAKYTGNFNPVMSVQDGLIGARTDSYVDSPDHLGTDTGKGGEVSGNYPTFNSLIAGPTYNHGNLYIEGDGNTGYYNAIARASMMLPLTGKYAFEFYCLNPDGTGSPGRRDSIGIFDTTKHANTYLTNVANSVGFQSFNGNAVVDESTVQSGIGAWDKDDVAMCAIDCATGKVWFGVNGSWTGDPAAGSGQATTLTNNGFLAFAHGNVHNVTNSGYTSKGYANFGQRPFAYTLPSGFKALCSTNLPNPTIVKPNTVFDTVLWAGGDSQKSLGFSPDMVWTKRRNAASYGSIIDRARGDDKYWQTWNTTTEQTNSDILTLDSDGFTPGTTFPSGSSNVTWCWDCGASAATASTAGSTNAQASWVNADAGFSMTLWEGTGSATTVGHSLGVKPDLIITYSREYTTNKSVYHSSQGAGKAFILNENYAAFTPSPITAAWNNTEPTTSVFSVGTYNSNNSSGNDMIAYCWASKAGYSKIGSYAGGGFPYIDCGFRPRWLLIKSATQAYEWHIIDSERNPFNGTSDLRLKADTDAVEVTGSHNMVDFTANGFKLTHADGNWNGSGQTFIYAAFAESPAKYSRAF